MCSLEAKLTSAQERDKLVEVAPNILGGEMEGCGVAADLNRWIVIKTVSDAGDETYDISNQKQAADKAAEVACMLARDHPFLPEAKLSPSATTQSHLLNDLIEGLTIHVVARDIHPDSLNDYLNDDIGASLELRTTRYISPNAYDIDLIAAVNDAVLEIVQNAFKHGGADSAAISTHPTKVTIDFDGGSFDLDNIQGHRGGSRALTTLKSYISNDQSIRLTQKRTKKGNQISVHLTKAGEALSNAKLHCQLSVNEGEIGRAFGRPQPLSYAEGCEEVYVNARMFRMMSRRLDVMAALEEPLSRGVRVFIACATINQVNLYLGLAKESAFEHLISVFVG